MCKKKIWDCISYCLITKIFVLLIIGVVLPLLVAFLIMKMQDFYNFSLNVNDTILMFVGILATFIVVSNYAQVKSLEAKLETIKEDSFRETKSLETDLYRLSGFVYAENYLFKDNDATTTLIYCKSCDFLLEYYERTDKKDEEVRCYLDELAKTKPKNNSFDATFNDDLKKIMHRFERLDFIPIVLYEYFNIKYKE